MKKAIPYIATAIAMLGLTACATIERIGDFGPKKLNVYAISQNDFLTANRMLVVVDKKGNVVASSGGTVSGPGTVGIETAGTVATAGSFYFGAKAIEQGVENAHVTVKGVPTKFNANVRANIHASGIK